MVAHVPFVYLPMQEAEDDNIGLQAYTSWVHLTHVDYFEEYMEEDVDPVFEEQAYRVRQVCQDLLYMWCACYMMCRMFCRPWEQLWPQ